MNHFCEMGGLVTVPAGSGFNGVSPVVLVSYTIPSGVRAYLESFTAKIIDIGSDQISVSLRLNGSSLFEGLDRISGVVFDDMKTWPVETNVSPGVIDLVAYNKSGTTQPGAILATVATCQASIRGSKIPGTRPQPSFLARALKQKLSFYRPFLLLIPFMGFASLCFAIPQDVVPGQTPARSAQPVACVNPSTFALESCGGSGGSGLTDAQLRATPVPVSGTFWQATQPVSGPLTDAQLRAVPVPVSGTVAATQSGNWVSRVVGNIGAIFDAPNNTAMPANAVILGCQSLTYGTQPTASTTGNARYVTCTTEGAIQTTPGLNRFSCFVQAVTVMTQCQAAPAAGLRAYILSAALTNQAATVQTLDLVFGTGANCATAPTALTHKWQFGTLATTTSPYDVFTQFDSPLVPTAANAICIRPSAATAFGATLTGYIAP